jgi:hypothetical protein
VVAEADGCIVASNVLDERSTIAAASCSMESNKRVQTVVEHNDRGTGYATSNGRFEHEVGESNEDLKALSAPHQATRAWLSTTDTQHRIVPLVLRTGSQRRASHDADEYRSLP